MPKIINTSHTTNTVGLPFLARSVNWLQEKTDEQDIAMIQSLNQNTNTSEVWQLYFKNIRNTSGTTWVWDAGAVLYNAKIYNSDSGTVTLGGGESLVYYFITTAQSGEPTTYTDASTFQTNENVKIGICKNTENVSQQIQAVNIGRVINLEKSGNSGALNYRLIKRGNIYNLSVNGQTVGSSVTILNNYIGNSYNNDVEAGVIFWFTYYELELPSSFGLNRGFLQKTGTDLVLNIGASSGTVVNFSVSWVQ